MKVFRSILTLTALAALPTFAFAQSGTTVPVNVKNNTYRHWVVELYIASPGDDDWGPNYLANIGEIAPDDQVSFQITENDTCFYDILVVLDGREWETGQSFCAEPTLVISD
ncbi:MAG: hypothetical protein B7X53_06900 [Hyphomonas sp. 34-62-18]|nr:hypothetical protein [Hyphomonas sp. 34-62-18]OZB17189.1 MAG: hypothetical protein B7X53_06900 [Hyphomonas sp. 34-62-18]